MSLLNLKGQIFVLLSAVLFGSYGVWAVLLGSDFGVFYQGYVRSFLVLLVLVPLVLLTKSWKPLTRDDIKAYAWCCGFGIFTQAPLYYAFQHAGVGIVSLIFFAVSLVTAYIVGALLLDEQITKIKFYSLILGIVGLLVVFSTSLGTFSVLALLLAGFNGIASGGEVATTKLVPEKFSAMQTSIMVWGSIFVTHLSLSFLLGETQILPAFNIHWLAMLGFTLAGVCAFWLVIEGYKSVDASVGGLIGLLEVVFAILFGVLVFYEVITVSIVVGSCLIIGAAMLPHVWTLLSRKTTAS